MKNRSILKFVLFQYQLLTSWVLICLFTAKNNPKRRQLRTLWKEHAVTRIFSIKVTAGEPSQLRITNRGGHTMVTMEFRHRTRDLGCSLYADCRGKHFGTLGICLQLAIFAQSWGIKWSKIAKIAKNAIFGCFKKHVVLIWMITLGVFPINLIQLKPLQTPWAPWFLQIHAKRVCVKLPKNTKIN